MNNLTPTSQKHGKGEAEDGEQSSHMRIMAGNMGDGDPEKPTSVGHEHLHHMRKSLCRLLTQSDYRGQWPTNDLYGSLLLLLGINAMIGSTME